MSTGFWRTLPLVAAAALVACGPPAMSEEDRLATAQAAAQTEAARVPTNTPVPSPTPDLRVFEADDPEADGLKCETALPLPADVVTEADLRRVAVRSAAGGHTFRLEFYGDPLGKEFIAYVFLTYPDLPFPGQSPEFAFAALSHAVVAGHWRGGPETPATLGDINVEMEFVPRPGLELTWLQVGRALEITVPWDETRAPTTGSGWFAGVNSGEELCDFAGVSFDSGPLVLVDALDLPDVP